MKIASGRIHVTGPIRAAVYDHALATPGDQQLPSACSVAMSWPQSVRAFLDLNLQAPLCELESAVL